MPVLEPIVATLVANTDEFIASLDKTKAEMQGLADDARVAGAETGAGLSEGVKSGTAGMDAEMAAQGELAGAAARDGVKSGADGVAEDMAMQGQAAGEAAREGVARGADGIASDMGAAGMLAGSNLHSGIKSEADRLEGDMGRSGAKAGEALEKGVKEPLGGIGKVLSSLGVPEEVLTGYGALGVGVAAAAGVMLDFGTKMQDADTAIANSAGISVKAATAIGNAFLGTAGQSRFSGREMAEAFAGVAGQLKTTEGAALTTGQSLTFMTNASDLAEASGQDLSSTTSTLSQVLQTFQLPLKDTADATNALFNASRETGTSVDAFGTQLDRVRSRMGAVSPSIKEMSALVVDMAKTGETGRMAMSGLGSVFTQLLKPSADVKTAQDDMKVALAALPPRVADLAEAYQHGTINMKQLQTATYGLSTTQAQALQQYTAASGALGKAQEAQTKMGVAVTNTKGQLLPMVDIIGQLHDKVEGETKAEALNTLTALGLGSAASKLVGVIMKGPEAYQKNYDAINKTNSAHEAAINVGHTLSAEYDTLKASLEDWVTELGQELLPVMQTVIGFITSTVVPILGTVLKAAFAVVATVIKIVVEALKTGIDIFHRFEPVILAIAAILAVVLIPTLIKMGVEMAMQADRAISTWVSTQARFAETGAKAVAQNAVHMAAIIADNLGLKASWIENALTAESTDVDIEASKSATAAAIRQANQAIIDSDALLGESSEEVADYWTVNIGRMDAATQAAMESMDADIAAAGVVTEETFADMADASLAASEEMDAAMGASGIGAVLMGVGLAATLLMGHWKMIWDAIKDAVLVVWHFLDNDILHPIEAAFADVVDFVKSHWKELVPIIAIVAAPLIALLAPIILIGVAIFELVKHWKTVWGDIKDTALAVWHFLDNDIFHPIMDVIDTVVDWVKSHWELLAGILLAPFAIVILVFTKFRTQIKQIFEDVWHFIVNAWDVITGAVSTGISKVVGFFTALPGQILGAVAGFASLLLNTGLNLIEGLWHGITNAWGHVYSFFKDMAMTVLVAIGNAELWLLHIGIEVIEGLWHGLTSAWSMVVNFVNSIGTRILAMLVTAGTWLLKTGLDIIKGLWHGLSDAAVDVWHFFDNVYHWVLNFFKDAGKWLLDAGKDIIKGLWNGLKDMGGSVTNWIGGFGSSIVSGFSSVLGIFSPSTVFRNAGMNIMLGLAGGVTGNVGTVMAAMNAVATQMPAEGVKIMHSFLDGLRSGWASIRSFLASIKPMVISEFASAGTWLQQAGRDLIGGLAKGISSNAANAAKTAQDAARNAATSATNAAGTNPSGPGGGAAGVGVIPTGGGVREHTTVLQVTSPINIDGRTVAQAVQKYLIRSSRAQGNALGRYAGGTQTATATATNSNAVAR